MNRPRIAIATGVALLAAPLAACGAGQPTGSAVGEDLAPTFEAAPDAGRGQGKAGRRPARPERTRRAAAKPPRATSDPSPSTERVEEDGAGGSGGSDGNGSGSPGGSGRGGAAPAGPLRARVSDGHGDVAGSLTSAPAYVDLVGATLLRGDGGWTMTFDVAGAVPSRAEGSRTMNVVGYVDIDRDGRIDHELLGHLSDSGWSGSHRAPDGARYGRDSGVTVRVRGRSIELRFPLDHLGSAERLQWAAASEYGTAEQVATGTTASDHAPDGGAAAFPG